MRLIGPQSTRVVSGDSIDCTVLRPHVTSRSTGISTARWATRCGLVMKRSWLAHCRLAATWHRRACRASLPTARIMWPSAVGSSWCGTMRQERPAAAPNRVGVRPGAGQRGATECRGRRLSAGPGRPRSTDRLHAAAWNMPSHLAWAAARQVRPRKIFSGSTAFLRISSSSGLGIGVSTASSMSSSNPVSACTRSGVRPG